MKPLEEVTKIIDGFGQKLTLKTADGEKEFKAFLQPLRYKNKMYLGAVSTELRYDTSRKYLLLAPSDVTLTAADGDETVIFGEGKTKYVIDRSEVIYLSGKPLYTWAVVTAL